MRRPPISTLFPYTTLSRSTTVCAAAATSQQEPKEASKPIRLLLIGNSQCPTIVSDQLLEKLAASDKGARPIRSEEHTSELQSRQYLVCRLLLEEKKETLSY